MQARISLVWLATPPPTCLRSVHSRAVLPQCIEPKDPSLDCVSPSWFCTTSMISAASPVVGLLHPTAGHEVRRVSSLPFTLPYPKVGMSRCKHRIRERRDHSRDANHTLRRIPLFNSRTASLRPLPVCRFYDSQALLRRKVRSVEHRCRW